MPTKKKRFSRSKRYNPTIRRNKNKLKKIQTGGTNSDIFVETSPNHWMPARRYQKEAFREFIQRYKTGLTFSNHAGNFNPENNFAYNDTDKNIHFSVFGEIYIRTQDGRIMRIKSVLRPEGSPEPDYDNEEPTTGTNDKYFFRTNEGDYYFNNTINNIIEQNKAAGIFKVYTRYEFRLSSPKEVKFEPRVKNIGTVRINSSDYPLFYKFIPGYVLDQIY